MDGDACQGDDPLFFAIIPKSSGTPAGVESYLRISPPSGSIEVATSTTPNASGRVPSSPAMFLMMMRAFALGYRKYEWKCDALNAPSRAAAQRLGLSYEGTFRQAMVYKGRSRDTSWYAAIDADGLPCTSLSPNGWIGNFDQHGGRRTRLSDFTRIPQGARMRIVANGGAAPRDASKCARNDAALVGEVTARTSNRRLSPCDLQKN